MRPKITPSPRASVAHWDEHSAWGFACRAAAPFQLPRIFATLPPAPGDTRRSGDPPGCWQHAASKLESAKDADERRWCVDSSWTHLENAVDQRTQAEHGIRALGRVSRLAIAEGQNGRVAAGCSCSICRTHSRRQAAEQKCRVLLQAAHGSHGGGGGGGGGGSLLVLAVLLAGVQHHVLDGHGLQQRLQSEKYIDKKIYLLLPIKCIYQCILKSFCANQNETAHIFGWVFTSLIAPDQVSLLTSFSSTSSWRWPRAYPETRVNSVTRWDMTTSRTNQTKRSMAVMIIWKKRRGKGYFKDI